MDARVSKFDVYTVYSIGDQFMIVSGLPKQNDTRHATEIASMALQLVDSVKVFPIRHKPNERLQLRIGIHRCSILIQQPVLCYER